MEGHIAYNLLRVSDVERSISFYTEILGMECLKHWSVSEQNGMIQTMAVLHCGTTRFRIQGTQLASASVRAQDLCGCSAIMRNCSGKSMSLCTWLVLVTRKNNSGNGENREEGRPDLQSLLEVNNVYWKIGLSFPDVDEAVRCVREKSRFTVHISEPSQFLDIGYLCHTRDPDGFCIEFLQHTFQDSNRPVPTTMTSGETKQSQSHQIASVSAPLPSSDSQDAVKPDPSMVRSKDFNLSSLGQITLRITEVEKTLDFYQDMLGMKLMAIMPVKEHRFTLYFLAFTSDESPNGEDLEAIENREWLWQRPYTTLELQYRWQDDSAVSPHRRNEDGSTSKNDSLQFSVQIDPEREYTHRLTESHYVPGPSFQGIGVRTHDFGSLYEKFAKKKHGSHFTYLCKGISKSRIFASVDSFHVMDPNGVLIEILDEGQLLEALPNPQQRLSLFHSRTREQDKESCESIEWES